MWNKLNVCVVALMVIILTICAFLPAIVLKTADRIADSKVYYSDIKSVSFESESNETNISNLLYLLNNGIYVDESEENMNYKKKDLPGLVRKAISPYVENGLIPAKVRDFSITNAIPMRLYGYTDLANTGAYWVLDLLSRDNDSHFLHLLLDDATGGIFVINYISGENVYQSDEENLVRLHKELVNTFSDSIGAEITSYEYEDTLYDRNLRTYTVKTSYGDVYLSIMLAEGGFSVVPSYQYESEENIEYGAESYTGDY